jgi:hypothetical protein
MGAISLDYFISPVIREATQRFQNFLGGHTHGINATLDEGQGGRAQQLKSLL